jgi:hypothetical protein
VSGNITLSVRFRTAKAGKKAISFLALVLTWFTTITQMQLWLMALPVLIFFTGSNFFILFRTRHTVYFLKSYSNLGLNKF